MDTDFEHLNKEMGAHLDRLEAVVVQFAAYDALAESHAELVAALGDLADCRWFRQTTSVEVDQALGVWRKARALVPEAK